MALGFAMALTARAGLGGQEPSVPPSVSRGARLFDGTEPLAGTLAGHSAPLPAVATRCSQCHAGPGGPGGPAATGSLFAPALDRGALREARPRRGGPPVAYEAATFCRTLRTGIDPAHVVLPRAMPRFELDDVQCAALWDYLTQEVRR
jgi:hypothetical protein